MTDAVELSPAAVGDLDEIAATLVKDGTGSAAAFLTGIERRCRVVSRTAATGTDRSDLMDGLRSRANGPYVLFYRTENGTVRIERVLHHSRYVPPPWAGELSDGA